ncbi:hypothetical protein DNHGIG_23740 [Collibacillus ludicampi]|uniref:Uncharacterized protein n=1 Tax=Collibacillus ludicampi TaxID=2771369 RepID=A0AAV4LG81_9BACL|nr:hypothetical protein [Collibacillus ludicampi]GIM46825.1 hypothetical protein DNHGIG_23740 [Collibacillus ludicampi]
MIRVNDEWIGQAEPNLRRDDKLDRCVELASILVDSYNTYLELAADCNDDNSVLHVKRLVERIAKTVGRATTAI